MTNRNPLLLVGQRAGAHRFVFGSLVCLSVLFSAELHTASAPANRKTGQASSPAQGISSRLAQPPTFERPARGEFTFSGVMGERIAANVRHWILCAPASNPAMLQILRDNERTPRRDLVPWAGEFAGKYLISAVQARRLSHDPTLKAHLQQFVADLIAAQDADGYLGPFPRDVRMTGKGLWDLWGQYHVMLGLYAWFKETGDPAALAACRRTADFFCRTFLDGDQRVLHAGSEEMNESSSHIFALLYQQTGEPRYLQLLREIEKDWETPPSGDYVRTALAGKPFFQTPKPRWESLHSIQAIAELHFITGEEKYRRAFEQIWWSIVEFDRHNNGGFSSGEQAQGNPYDPRPIETCCTIAWMAITIDMLRLTGDARAADELELATWNSVLGAQNAAGRWWTYNTPMDGERKASAHDIVFQARAGSPELNCCSVNGPRGLGMLSEWAVMQARDGVVMNYFGPGEFTVRSPSGRKIRFRQETDFPVGGAVRVVVTPEAPESLVLRLRLPGWSRTTTVTLNGKTVEAPEPGNYLVLDRRWKRGDEIRLTFDMSPRLWVGEREAAGKVSIYHGPLLLAYDPRFDTHDPTHLPSLDLQKPPATPALSPPSPAPLLLRRFASSDGREITLCDFASAGAGGNRYVSWLAAAGVSPVAFGRSNPLRAVWLR
jgi:hypothetical protein